MKRIVTIFTIACVLLSMSMLLPVSAATVDFSVNFDDEPDFSKIDPARFTAADKWILSACNTLVREVTENLENIEKELAHLTSRTGGEEGKLQTLKAQLEFFDQMRNTAAEMGVDFDADAVAEAARNITTTDEPEGRNRKERRWFGKKKK